MMILMKNINKNLINPILLEYYPTYNPSSMKMKVGILNKRYNTIYQDIQSSKNAFLENSQKFIDKNMFRMIMTQ